MKKLKQVVSLLLVAVMCLGLLPAMAAPAGAGTITVKTTDTVTGQPLSNTPAYGGPNSPFNSCCCRMVLFCYSGIHIVCFKTARSLFFA